MMAEDRIIKLQRRQAMKRKPFLRSNDPSMNLSRITECQHSSSGEDADDEETCKGSSIDLTPTLLGIYDKIASSSKGKDGDPDDQSNFYYFSTNENLEDGSDDQCHSPTDSPTLSRKPDHQRKFRKGGNRGVNARTDQVDSAGNVIRPGRMDLLDNKHLADLDCKKRPLSISSMSSSSTSSLPRRRKRPNLSDYTGSASSSQLDIEKLDNLLYIDDGPEIPERSADELSVCSDDKQKSGGDSDSLISTDQSELSVPKSPSFQQSDSNSLSFLPANMSANSSTADLSMNSPDLGSCTSMDDRVRRSCSRTSQRSTAMSRSASQKGHYVSYVQRVATELVETERIYVLHLQEIIEGYYEYLRDTTPSVIPPTEMECLFGNIVQIYDFSCGFLGELEACGLDPVELAECFVKNNAGFVIYAEYCTNYPSAVAILTKVMRDSQLSEIFKQRQLYLQHSLPLGAYLLKPVQRVLKYHLLLQNVLKHYNTADPGYEKLVAAHDHMTQMSHHINEMKLKHEQAVRVQEIQSQLEDYEGEDFTRLGELVLEGSFRMFGVKASRQMFLFEKGVIIAKRKEDGMLGCKAYIPCATLMLVESIPKEPLNFQILPFDNPRGSHTIHARNLEQKRKWCQEIKRLILNSYASKIPDSVKDLVIEKLGKSKEEDALAHTGNTDPGKSHVTTPEYLEKRLRARRKSGTALLQEILKPQRNRRFAGKNRENANSKSNALDMSYTKEDMEHFGLRHKLLGFGKDKNASSEDNQENKSPGGKKGKRPLSIRRSQSFQSREKVNSLASQSYMNDSPSMDALDNLAKSDGPSVRTNSFRLATRVAPIKFDSLDSAVLQAGENDSGDNLNNGAVLRVQKNVDNIPASVRKSIENIDSPDKLELTLSPKEVYINKPDNLNGSYLDEASYQRKARYSSMPVLNATPPSSPKIQRLQSERFSESPTLNHKLPVHYAKRIDIQPYFSVSRDKINDLSKSMANGQSKVNAFHDTFNNPRKSPENVFEKNHLVSKSLTLTQPKPFTSSLRASANLLTSQARLNRWGPEKFTKGSLSDLSHLKEDPWIRNKQRSFTESRVTLENKRSPRADRKVGRAANKQVSRPSLDAQQETRRTRTRSVDSETCDEYTDNMDWLVYANRNSIPVSAISTEDISRKFKYCTPPRGSMVPPPCSEGKSPYKPSTLASPEPSHHSSYHGNTTGDSSISLSANTSSSETCSSPDILKDCVFDETSSVEKVYTRDRTQVSRSFSTPNTDQSHIKSKRHLQDDRPASADVLGDVNQIEESDRLLEEMERYMKHSTSSSGSLSSSNRFPINIPSFQQAMHHHHHHHHHRDNKNRHSGISTGSASSYESTGDTSSEPQSEEGLVDSIKSKINTLASKITGKRGTMSEAQNIETSTTNLKYKQDDHPSKLSHFSFRSKPGMAKSPERDLPTMLRDTEQGSRAIGSRIANSDLDDYATFSLPRQHDTVSARASTGHIQDRYKKLQLGKHSSVNLDTRRPADKPHTNANLQAQSETRLFPANTSLTKTSGAQSDSAFSIQSVDIDSSTPEDSPRDADTNSTGKSDNFYERRLSEVFSSDDAFRDSAVYCDDVDSNMTQQQQTEAQQPLSPNINIKSYIQQLEEKNRPKSAPVQKVCTKKPSDIIRSRIESLAANSEYHSKSSGASRNVSATHSRSHSRSSSRASSEEKRYSTSMLKDFIDSKFPVDKSKTRAEDDGAFVGQALNPSYSKMKPAHSMGRLDALKNDVENLVVMKGWVKELVEKFQK